MTADKVTPSPTNSLRRIGSRDRLKQLVGLPTSSSTVWNASDHGTGDELHHVTSLAALPHSSMKRVSSSSSIASAAAIGSLLNPVSIPYAVQCVKIWQGLLALEKDPHPEVAQLAHSVISSITSKAHSTSRDITASASPSSSKANLTIGGSPPHCVTPGTSPQTFSALHTSTPNKSLTNRIRRVSDRLSSSHSFTQEESCEVECIHQPLLQSNFVEWSTGHFSRATPAILPEMDPESAIFHHKASRYKRNECLRKDASIEQVCVLTKRLDEQTFIVRNPRVPAVVKFHPYDPHLAVADKSHCSVWDWEKGSLLCTWHNCNAKEARITALEYVNAHEENCLLVGTDEGAVRVWKNFLPSDEFDEDVKNPGDPQLVTSWQVLSELLPSTKGSGIVMHWSQTAQQLAVSGDVRVVRLWDVAKELRILDLPTGAESCITCLSRERDGSPLLVAGCGDGSVRLYDIRKPSAEARVMTWREHNGYILEVFLQSLPTGPQRVISGCVPGDVRIWELRKPTSVSCKVTSPMMTAMTVHPQANIYACGSVNQFIGVYTTSGEQLSAIKYHDGFMGQRIGPVSCLTFHRHLVRLAAGSTDAFISVYSLNAFKPWTPGIVNIRQIFMQRHPGVLYGNFLPNQHPSSVTVRSMSGQSSGKQNHRSTIMYVASVGILILGLSYAAVPLYRIFCQAYSFGGTVNENTDLVEKMRQVPSRKVKIRFNADTAASLRWNFKPQQTEIFVDMPVFFYIDPEFAEDPKMENVTEITLSYTFFEAKQGLELPVPAFHVT
ncbi:unnamed protein product [Darwinula stevensoni]|uniref:Uncharacterized protein n=1 Tax=Darwinula stevensoni TaxID=69355 RepID=A0A7R9A583_9CRUS|nr:unnamed protein product [Darwinula stevensoni]CAG0893874.1 unnamed protein product [Darwinula stevensoni]